MKIILISGKAEAGKTTAANYIKTMLTGLYKKKVAIIPYGAYLKFTAEKVWEWDGKKDETGRQLLQWWGTDVVRKADPDFWVRAVGDLAVKAKSFLDYLIIDDCRFKNEIEWWKNQVVVETSDYNWEDHLVTKRRWPDIFTLRIERPGHENALTPEQREHPSETELDHYIFDQVISATDSWDLVDALNLKVIPKIV